MPLPNQAMPNLQAAIPPIAQPGPPGQLMPLPNQAVNPILQAIQASLGAGLTQSPVTSFDVGDVKNYMAPWMSQPDRGAVALAHKQVLDNEQQMNVLGQGLAGTSFQPATLAGPPEQQNPVYPNRFGTLISGIMAALNPGMAPGIAGTLGLATTTAQEDAKRRQDAAEKRVSAQHDAAQIFNAAQEANQRTRVTQYNALENRQGKAITSLVQAVHNAGAQYTNQQRVAATIQNQEFIASRFEANLAEKYAALGEHRSEYIANLSQKYAHDANELVLKGQIEPLNALHLTEIKANLDLINLAYKEGQANNRNDANILNRTNIAEMNRLGSQASALNGQIDKWIGVIGNPISSAADKAAAKTAIDGLAKSQNAAWNAISNTATKKGIITPHAVTNDIQSELAKSQESLATYSAEKAPQPGSPTINYNFAAPALPNQTATGDASRPDVGPNAPRPAPQQTSGTSSPGMAPKIQWGLGIYQAAIKDVKDPKLAAVRTMQMLQKQYPELAKDPAAMAAIMRSIHGGGGGGPNPQ